MHMPGQIPGFVGFAGYAYVTRVLVDYRNHFERNDGNGDTIKS
jgi:hypothetical protein